MSKNIRCISCKHTRPDPTVSEGQWTAYQCGNAASEYHKALVNVAINGDRQHRISWSGCPLGERRDS